MIRGLTVNEDSGEVVIARGDDQTIRFTVRDFSGALVNCSAGTFKFTVKESIDDDIADALFQLQSPAANGIDLTSAASGIVDVNIRAADTASLAGMKWWDLQMTLSSNVRTLAGGVFRVAKNVSTVGVAGSASSPVAPFPGHVSIDRELYLLDTITGLYSGFRVENGELKQSVAQSATVPFVW